MLKSRTATLKGSTVETKQLKDGTPVRVNSRVTWTGDDVVLSAEDQANGYRDVKSGSIGRIVELTHCAGPNVVAVLFDGHVKPISLGLDGFKFVAW